MTDSLILEVHDLVVNVLTGIYSQETHLPQPLKISISASLDIADHYAPDTPLSWSKNYMKLKEAATHLPEGVHFTLIEAVADHIIGSLFESDSRINYISVKIVKLAIAEDDEAIGITMARSREMNRKLALVTGGKRRLGAAIARRLAVAGFDLALVSHVDKQPEPELIATLANEGVAWRSFVHDLSEPAGGHALIKMVSAHFGRAPDLLVNNAAMFRQDDWQSMSASSLSEHFGLNLFAPLLLAQALVQVAGEGRQPSIVNILDQRVVNPHGDQLSYTLSKQALAASVRSMASAFGARARVNGVAPGLVIATDDYDAVQEQRLGGMMPLGALPSPSGVADAVLYLASAADVTGQTIFVDGGAHLKSFDRDFMYL